MVDEREEESMYWPFGVNWACELREASGGREQGRKDDRWRWRQEAQRVDRRKRERRGRMSRRSDDRDAGNAARDKTRHQEESVRTEMNGKLEGRTYIGAACSSSIVLRH